MPLQEADPSTLKMNLSNDWTAAIILIVARWIAQLCLEHLNQRHVQNHASTLPEAFHQLFDPVTYSRSVQYTLARSRLRQLENTVDVMILVAVLFSGLLGAWYHFVRDQFGSSALSGAGFILSAGLAFSLLSLPFDWSSQFRLEERFGFNTSTQQLWWTDRTKGFLLALLLGFPLLVLILKLVDWSGPSWWIWAWLAVLLFQLTVLVLAPILILPLFNKFSPLPHGSLQDRLFALAQRTCFHVSDIQIMDGSKRSRHSNAFFTGLGRFRKIILFDTLIQQLSESEIEAVLAHEIGHYKLKHIPKLLAVSAASLFAMFWALNAFLQTPQLYQSFGFPASDVAPALLVFALLIGTITFWFSPFTHYLSRRFEFQADRFAAKAVADSQWLIGALRKLNQKNLSNLNPHPLYSWFYYSHPTLIEREAAIQKIIPILVPSPKSESVF